MSRQNAKLAIRRRNRHKRSVTLIGEAHGAHDADTHNLLLPHLAGALAHVLNRGSIAECLLGQVIGLAVDNLGEGADGILDTDVDAGVASELLGNVEGLREELLNLTGTVDRKALLLGQLVHTQNGDDVLKVGVLLQELLNLDGDTVVLLADDRGIESVGGRRERVDGREQAERRNATRKNRSGVEVRKRRGRRRVGQVVCGDVDSLDGGNGARLGRGNALLEVAHLGSQRGW